MPTLSNRRLQAAIDRQERLIREAFLQAIREHGESINLTALAEALEAGDIARAVSLAQITPAKLFALDAAITAAFMDGGQMVREAAPKFAVSFGFDGRAFRAEQWARQNAAGLVVDISNEQADALRAMTQERLAQGANARKLAREVRSVVGLAPSQVQTVNNVRADLENLSPDYFSRKLRDKRFDGIVRRAIRDGKALSQVDIDRITARYAERALRFRADNIAKTESLNALRAGRDEGIRQAIEQGAIAPGATQKVWDSSGDARVRPDHRAMDGQSVGMNEPFVAPDGSRLMYPGDSSLGAGADQIINCRCVVDYRVDWLRG